MPATATAATRKHKQDLAPAPGARRAAGPVLRAEHLIRAAQLRVAGWPWGRIAKILGVSRMTANSWPDRWPAEWARAVRRALDDIIVTYEAEALKVVRSCLRGKERLRAAAILLEHSRKLRDQVVKHEHTGLVSVAVPYAQQRGADALAQAEQIIADRAAGAARNAVREDADIMTGPALAAVMTAPTAAEDGEEDSTWQ